jgi:hypothetical protein
MSIRVVIARLAWFAVALVAFGATQALVPSRAFALEASTLEDGLDQSVAADGECEDAGLTLCPFFDEDELPPALCAEDGSARVAPPPSLPVAPDKIEGPRKCALDHVLRVARHGGPDRDAPVTFATPEPVDPATLPALPAAAGFGASVLLGETPYRLLTAAGVRPVLERPPTQAG